MFLITVLFFFLTSSILDRLYLSFLRCKCYYLITFNKKGRVKYKIKTGTLNSNIPSLRYLKILKTNDWHNFLNKSIDLLETLNHIIHEYSNRVKEIWLWYTLTKVDKLSLIRFSKLPHEYKWHVKWKLKN